MGGGQILSLCCNEFFFSNPIHAIVAHGNPHHS